MSGTVATVISCAVSQGKGPVAKIGSRAGAQHLSCPWASDGEDDEDAGLLAVIGQRIIAGMPARGKVIIVSASCPSIDGESRKSTSPR